MNIKPLNPEKKLSQLSFKYPSSFYNNEEDLSEGGEDNRLAMEVFLINNELDGGETVKTYLREFQLDNGMTLECLGTITKSENGNPGMCFMLKKWYFEDQKTQDKVQSLCSAEFEKLFFKWHPRYFNSKWKEKFPEMKQDPCYPSKSEGGKL
jgi:hypothetical protein